MPLWAAAVLASLGRMVWASIEKMAFRTVAFLQLTWGWRLLTWVLPEAVLERKRRLDFRVARIVVRRRRLTLKQLADKKDSLPMRLALIAEYLRQPAGRAPDPTDDTPQDTAKDSETEPANGP